MENICHFIPHQKEHDQIQILNFVLENERQVFTCLKTEAVYKLHLVCGGTGKLHTPGRKAALLPGDIFFTFPAEAYAIESEDDLSYYYISFLGNRANQIMEKLNISRKSFLFSGFAALLPFWTDAIGQTGGLPELVSESVLLYSFSALGQAGLVQENIATSGSAYARIKKFVDEHFTDADLNLETVGRRLNYNPKYISTVFKKHTGVGLSQYLSIIRIQHSCTLISQGFTGVGDLSFHSGFSDPHYFSRVFKQLMHMTPMEYIRSERAL